MTVTIRGPGTTLKALGILLAVIGLSATPSLADPALDALVAAYPDHLAGYDQNDVIWKDGTRMAISDGRGSKSFDELLDRPDIKDQFAIAYPLGADVKVPEVNQDPGRIRNERFFAKMYGDCRKGEVAKRLKPVSWMPGRGGGTVMATTVNGVNERLADVVKDLEKLPADMSRYLVPSAGIYNCRTIANTSRLSVHAFGAAIDVNAKFADYWEWSKGKDGKVAWKNRVPGAIGEIFERHGFIWGAKWYHFDSMHFEYRPEIISLARRGWPASGPIPKFAAPCRESDANFGIKGPLATPYDSSAPLNPKFAVALAARCARELRVRGTR